MAGLESSVNDGQQAFDSPTFGRDGSFHVDEGVGAASISPSGRDVVLASPAGLHIIDLDNPWSPPRHLSHQQAWEVADVQWSPHASRDYWVVSTSNQKALVWNLNLASRQSPIEFILHGHVRAITDINFSALEPTLLATSSVDSFIHTWDLRSPERPVLSFADWYAGASQVKWNRQDANILASSHDRYLHIWDRRKGAQPLRTIAAHATKIYGIDWNRTRPTDILTCSLDKSIKLWDYAHDDDVPKSVIRTTYPVWRARHTPFGGGILAMPQRGDYSLHLYDINSQGGAGASHHAIANPVHSFDGHNGQVKEFLWRAQGTVDHGVDSRQFQLVSWSTDRNLLLHRLDEDVLGRIGFRTGQSADDRILFTRKGAKYKTFHKPEPEPRIAATTSAGLTNLFRDGAVSDLEKPSISISGLAIAHFRSSEPRRLHHRGERQDADPIEWMKGVKIGESVAEGSDLIVDKPSDHPLWSTRESLGDEITQAGMKYRNTTFENVDVNARYATFSLSGPWGIDGHLTYMKVRIKFPETYPEISSPDVTIEKTSSVSDATLKKLRSEIKTLCDAYVDIGKGCLEGLMCYLLGETDLDETIDWVQSVQQAMTNSLTRAGDSDSSSDDEEDVLIGRSSLDQSGLDTGESGTHGPINANANVPLPKACGALWAPDGRLVCFFPSVNDHDLLLSTSNFGSGNEKSQSRGPFSSLGFFGLKQPLRRRKASSDSDSSRGSSGASATSSSSESDASEAPSRSVVPRAISASAYVPRPKLSASRSLDRQSSVRTTFGLRRQAGQQTISLQTLDELLPSKRYLAQEYQIMGDGSYVCAHNAAVARKHSHVHLADVWELVALIIREDVPLQALPSPVDEDADILILAKRVLVAHGKRKDSGFDLTFDKPESVLNPEFMGKTHWGRHALSLWLLPRIFDYFVERADTQMLAMLSCVLAEKSLNQDPVKRTVACPRMQAKQQILRLDKAPAFTSDYFESEEVAIALSQPLPIPSSPEQDSEAIDDQASMVTLNPLWEDIGTDPEYETRSTLTDLSPPNMTRQGSKLSQTSASFGTSPDEHIRRTHSILGNRLAASIARPFSFITSSSASPPSQSRTPELSTSAPSQAAFAPHSWGRSSSYNEAPSLRRDDSRSSLQYELDIDSISSVVSSISDEDEMMRVTLTNTDKFEEGTVEPLLGPLYQDHYALWRDAYADLLFAWQLPLQRAEILKFNHLHVQSQTIGETHHPYNISSTGHSQSYEVEQLRLDKAAKVYCSICYEAMDSLHKTCLLCGHSSHADCMDVLTKAAVQLEDLQLLCHTGCGCSCTIEDETDASNSASVMGQSATSERLQRSVKEELMGSAG